MATVQDEGGMNTSEWQAFKQGFIAGFCSPIILLKSLFDRAIEGAGRI
jgi:hypothetical protein